MYQVSETYKKSMKKSLRNQTFMKVVLGLINQEAQNSAKVTDQNKYIGFSDFDTVFTKNDIGNIYATYEQDSFKCDGSLFFLPRDQDKWRKNGITQKDLFSGNFSIQFSFGYGKTDIKGLTIQFGENYPTDFSIITSDDKEVQFENTQSYFQTDLVFANTETITIKINELAVPNGRVRLFYVKFGIGLEYDNEYIKNADSSCKLSVINEELPEINFSVVLKNEDQRFNVDNPSSEINFFETGQKISVIYQQELENGEIESLQQHDIIVSDWSADDSSATIKAVDKFHYMSDNYYKGQYYENGISLYDLALLVFEDAGIGENEYYLDSYLKKVTVKNPLPNVTHKEALQIIANAGRCVMDYDRYGRIRIYSMFLPDFVTSSNGAEYYSDIKSIDEQSKKESYATYEQGYWTANGEMLFLPKKGIQNTGYVSKQISGADCSFEENPIITRTMEAKYKCFGIRIKFTETVPKRFLIKTYADGIQNGNIEINKDIVLDYELNYEFNEFDKIEFEFIETELPNNRIHVNYIEFGEESDYRIFYDDLYSTPVGTKLENIKNINVTRSIFTKSEKEEELVTDTLVYDGKNHMYNLTDACYGYVVSLESSIQSAEIIESGAYYVSVKFKNVNIGDEIKLSIKGNKYNVSYEKYSSPVSNRGIDKEWINPLISDQEHCKKVSEWLADYFASGIEYELDYRGEPAIDAGDTIFQENRYEPNLKVVIEETQLSFNGGLSGALRTRRKERVVRAENKLGRIRQI